MATLQRRNDFPNLLVITGNDIVVPATDASGQQYDDLVEDWRTRVRNLLFSSTNGVRNFTGEVDFILCYVNRGRAADHHGFDHSVASRPLRGIIRLTGDQLAPANGNFDGDLSGGIAHEVGHYWLVPGGAQIITTAGPFPTPTPDAMAESLNRGNGLPDYAVMGREDSHWSPFIDSRNSPMDGINHSAPQFLLEALYGYAYTVGEQTTGVSFDLPGYRQIVTPHRYSDLELYLMGVLNPPAFSPASAVMNVIKPRWVFPVPFQAGLYVECDNGQVWYLGFDRGPHQIQAQAIDGTAPSSAIALRTPFNPADLVAVRAVQRGNELKLQVRLWRGQDPAESYFFYILRKLGAWLGWKPKSRPSSLSCSDILGDVSSGGAPSEATNSYASWKTLVTLNAHATQVGISARHLGHPCFARFRADLCMEAAGSVITVPLDGLTGTNLLDQMQPLFAKTLLEDGSFVLPYRTTPRGSITLEHTPTVDHAPRLITAAPQGDFSFGGWVRLLECCIVNWAGGNGIGKTYIGTRQRFRFDQFDFASAWGASTAIRRAPPPENTYKFLFCFMSENPVPDSELVPKLERLDLNRRAWEPCFREMTQGQRVADTSIP